MVHSKAGKIEIEFGIPKIRKYTGNVYYLYILGFPNVIISLPSGPSPGIGSNFLSKNKNRGIKQIGFEPKEQMPAAESGSF